MAPDLGATFVPSGFDDYYMPEVVAPAPQRVTPQVPQNMQDGLQRMELEATTVEPQARHTREPSLSTYMGQSQPQTISTPAADADIKAYAANAGSSKLDSMAMDTPSFSPFPKVKGDNIPPTDDEKEQILWNARKHVLHSQNVSMQIIWARDVLNWADISSDAAAREPSERQRPSTPRIEHELRTSALDILNYLARQEHPEALYLRSRWLEFGKFGNRVDKREAYAGYKRASELGNARSEYRMGMLFEQSNDMSKAKEHYYKGMSLKDSAALYRMGMMSLLGQHGESKDYSTGLDRIQAAADGADEDAPQGAYVYGMLVGRDLPDIHIPEGLLAQSAETAKMYVEKAAYLGFAKAQLKMGQACELCQFGCEFNPSYSLHYYGLAAKQGLPEAALGVSRWFLFGYEGVFKKNEELAYRYAQEAADAKLPTGAFAMGYYHEIGIHVNKSLAEARKWYELAADQGNKDAVSRLESLSQDKTLSKTDHETTTLTRIKSQHGSQRGKRPDRFKQPSQHMPTLSESAPQTPTNDGPMPPPKPNRSPGRSPGVSPQPSPGMRPVITSEHVDYPDPSRASVMGADRPSAFNLRLDSSDQPARPHSAAPYPDDDRPPPLNVNRPKSTAPYPDDAPQGPGGQQYNLAMRPGQGPHADRPGSAFGIKPQVGGPRPIPASQSMGNLHPQHPAGGDPRGRSWDAQGRGGGYRQPSPGPPGRPYPGDDMRNRPLSAQPYPNNGPGQMRPQQHNQYPPGPGGAPRPHSALPPAGSDPGRDYRRPVSDMPPPQLDPRIPQIPQNQERFSRVPGAGARPSPHEQQRLSSAPLGAGRPPAAAGAHGRPASSAGPGRVGTAPPAQGRPPGGPSPHAPSPAPSAATMPAKPGKAPPGKGPATFEDMGIPQGKQEGDCLVM